MLLFFDIETTGLDPDADHILQVAAAITTDDLERTCAEYARIVWQSEADLARMSDHVRDMHTRTGLLARIADGDGWHLSCVEDELCGWLEAVWQDEKIILAGDSIHFDRSFVRRHMPRFERMLHHRMVDTSTFRVLAELWKRPAFPGTNPKAHDALSDCRTSIEKLKHWRDRFAPAPVVRITAPANPETRRQLEDTLKAHGVAVSADGESVFRIEPGLPVVLRAPEERCGFCGWPRYGGCTCGTPIGNTD